MLIRGFLTLLCCLLAAPAWAATPPHDATTNTEATEFSVAQNPSYTHTPTGGACPNPVDIISVAWQDATPGTLTSVTDDGNTATSLGAAVSASALHFVQMFIQKNPNLAAKTIQANFSEVMNSVSIRTSTYCNVDQTTSTGTRATATGSSTTATVNVTSAAGELVVDAGESGNGGTSWTVGASQTQRYNNVVVGNHIHAGSEEAGAASVTMSWTLGSTNAWAIIGVPLKPSAGSTRRHIPPIIFE